jgi:hypothetical protein
MKQRVPRATARCWASSFSHAHSSHRAVATLLRVASTLTVVVPRAALAEMLRKALEGRDFYVAGELEPRTLLDPNLRSLLLISRGSHDLGRYLQTSPSRLHLGLPKGLHESAGLDGKEVGTVWMSTIEQFDAVRVKRAFGGLPRTLFFGCTEDNSPANVPLASCSLKLESKALPGLRWPAIGAAGEEERVDEIKAVLEWIGAVLTGATALTTQELSTNQLAPTFCNYRLSAVRDDHSGGFLLKWTGMLSAATCLHVLDVLRQALGPDEFAVLSVSGFSGAVTSFPPFASCLTLPTDALHSWGESEHGPSLFGDFRTASYAYFLQPDDTYYGYATGDDAKLPL